MKIRTIHQNELILLMNFSKDEGWDSEEIHIKALYETHPNDFFIASHEDTVIGFILAIDYGENFGFISNFLILKKFRGLGYGKSLFTYAMHHLQGKQIALDSVIEKQSIYKKAGFTCYFDVVTYKFEVGSLSLLKDYVNIINFDKHLSLLNQDKYMRTILSDKNILYKAIKKENKIKSFAFAFTYIDGYKVHIESDNVDEAVALFFALTNELKKATNIYLQATKLSPILLKLVKILKMHPYSKSIRMYNKILD